MVPGHDGSMSRPEEGQFLMKKGRGERWTLPPRRSEANSCLSMEDIHKSLEGQVQLVRLTSVPSVSLIHWFNFSQVISLKDLLCLWPAGPGGQCCELNLEGTSRPESTSQEPRA